MMGFETHDFCMQALVGAPRDAERLYDLELVNLRLRSLLAAFVAAAVAGGCGGEGDESRVGTETSVERQGLTSAETKWLAKARVDKALASIEQDYDRLQRTGKLKLTYDISSYQLTSGRDLRVGAGRCRLALQRAKRPPTARLRSVYDLTRRACIQVERATNQLHISPGREVTVDPNTGEATVRGAGRAAAASLTRAHELAAQARRVLTKLKSS